MARYTYGDTIYDLVAVPTADDGDYGPTTATSITVYTSRALTSPATDLLVRDAAGAFTVAASTVPVDTASGYLAGFQGPDGLFPLWMSTAAGPRAIWPPERDASTVPSATTDYQGIVERATTPETLAGADDTRYVTSFGVASAFNAHGEDPAAHPALSTAVGEMQAASASKADKVDGLVPLDQVPKSSSGDSDAIVQRRASGAGAFAVGVLDDEAAVMSQLRAITGGGGGTSDVRFRKVAAASLPVIGSAAVATWTAIPTALITDAASKQLWQCEYEAIYQATAVGGIQVRHKGNVSAPTNLLPNSSFETNTTGWSAGNAASSIARATSGGGFDGGTAYLTLKALSSGNLVAWSDLLPVGNLTTASAGVYARLGVGTGKNVRVDIMWYDAAGVTIATELGDAAGIVTPTSGGWTRAVNNPTVVPTPPDGATQFRFRAVYVQAAANDVVHLDAAQLEPSHPLPAYGSMGGSGASSIAVNGGWRNGLPLATPTTDNYSRIVPIRYPALANLTAAFGGLGATTDAYLAGSFTVEIAGTGLTSQRVELEFAPRVADGTNTPKLQWFAATFAKLI